MPGIITNLGRSLQQSYTQMPESFKCLEIINPNSLQDS